MKKLIEGATTWLFYLPKQVLQRSRKLRPKVELKNYARIENID